MSKYNIDIDISLIKNISAWVRIFFTSIVLSSFAVGLISAYIGSLDKTVVTIGLLLGALHGIYAAEKVRRTTGFVKYHQQVSRINHD